MSIIKQEMGHTIWTDKQQGSSTNKTVDNLHEIISVIVPVYNGEKYLENCIKSILAQTYQQFEIIIINDGSTDSTAEICKGLEACHENITVIHMNDEGVSAARNAGLKVVKGKYITFVDADDRLFPETLEKLYTAMKETGSDISGCGFVAWSREEAWQSMCEQMQDRHELSTEKKAFVTEDENEPNKYRDRIYETEAEGNYQLCTGTDFWQQGIYGGDTRCWSKLYKRSVIGETVFREGLTIGEDMLFLADILPKTERLVTIPYRGYGYYQNPSGAMLRKFTPGYMDQIACWEIARDKAIKEVPQLEDKASSVIMVSVMLTVGKIALLSFKERKQVKEYITICHEKLKEEMKSISAFSMLDRGYRIKTKFFRMFPNVYLWFYHLKKYKAG